MAASLTGGKHLPCRVGASAMSGNVLAAGQLTP